MFFLGQASCLHILGQIFNDACRKISRSDTTSKGGSKGVYIFKAVAMYCQSSFQNECTSLYAASSKCRLLPLGPNWYYHQQKGSIADPAGEFVLHLISLVTGYSEFLFHVLTGHLYPFVFLSPLIPAHFLCSFF